MGLLDIQAGPGVYQRIREQGLSAADVSAVIGASGAAKWLSIYGLDRAIFSQWLPTAQQQIMLFGTSVGAFKLAAACRRDPAAALDALADTYIEQSYPDGASRDAIAAELQRILHASLGDGAEEILQHPQFYYHCGAVRAKGLLSSGARLPQQLAMAQAFLSTPLGRSSHRLSMQRTVFRDPRCPTRLPGRDGFASIEVDLSKDNVMAAITASGSIPVMMYGQQNISGAPEGWYFDGGLLDYHPVPDNLYDSEGVVLYPHFYPQVKEGWFDKFYRWRNAKPDQLSRVCLLSPSAEFWASTRLGRVPDRRDFQRFANDDAQRIDLWREVADKTHQLGEAFLELVSSGDIRQTVRPLGSVVA